MPNRAKARGAEDRPMHQGERSGQMTATADSESLSDSLVAERSQGNKDHPLQQKGK